jgi:hypothetical protein
MQRDRARYLDPVIVVFRQGIVPVPHSGRAVYTLVGVADYYVAQDGPAVDENSEIAVR